MLVLEWEHLKTVKHETGIDYVEVLKTSVFGTVGIDTIQRCYIAI